MEVYRALFLLSTALLGFAAAAPEPIAGPEPAADPEPYLVQGFGSPLIDAALNPLGLNGVGAGYINPIALPQLVYTQNGNFPLPSPCAGNPIVPGCSSCGAGNANTVSKTTTVVSGPAGYTVNSVPVVSPVTTLPSYGSYLPVTGVSPSGVSASSAAVASAGLATAASAAATTNYVDPSIYSGYYGINTPYTGLCTSCLRKKRDVYREILKF